MKKIIAVSLIVTILTAGTVFAAVKYPAFYGIKQSTDVIKVNGITVQTQSFTSELLSALAYFQPLNGTTGLA